MWNRTLVLTWTALLFLGLASFAKAGQDPLPPISEPNASQVRENKGELERNFYEVLEDLMADFEYDLKNGNVTGLKDLAIRNIATSENVPPSFKNHLELLITEKILSASKTKVVQCLPCKARKTVLNGDQVVVTSPDTNPTELSRIAKMGGILHFLDSAFSYQPTAMVMSMHISDPDTGVIIWSRSYNSETSRASAFRRGVDYNQIDQARKETEYSPMIQHRLILYYLFQPDIPSGLAGCLALGYRMVERYDNRKKEVGFEANYMVNAGTIINSSGAVTTALYNAFGFNMTLLFLHAWNFIGEEENYNRIRGSFYAAIGGTYASGYLGGVVRTGYEFRLAKHFGVSANLGYRPPATTFFGGTASGTLTGAEFGLGVNVLF